VTALRHIPGPAQGLNGGDFGLPYRPWGYKATSTIIIKLLRPAEVVSKGSRALRDI
jgi:hypothetical protein